MKIEIKDLMSWWRSRSVARPTVVGVYALPRGGSNFVSAWLHYHPSIFAVSERHIDWRVPLWRYWRKRSILREHGVQAKSLESTSHVLFNKVQRDNALWGADTQLPAGAKLIFYVRNPVKIFLSRNQFRAANQGDHWCTWTATDENLEVLLQEVASVVGTYHAMKTRVPCMLLSHEYFCMNHASALGELYRFLGVPEIPLPDPRKFFNQWGETDIPLTEVVDEKGVSWLARTDSGERLEGFGNFNPLRKIDLKDFSLEPLKQIPIYEKVLTAVEEKLGHAFSDYYRSGKFERNISL